MSAVPWTRMMAGASWDTHAACTSLARGGSRLARVAVGRSESGAEGSDRTAELPSTHATAMAGRTSPIVNVYAIAFGVSPGWCICISLPPANQLRAPCQDHLLTMLR